MYKEWQVIQPHIALPRIQTSPLQCYYSVLVNAFKIQLICGGDDTKIALIAAY
jgi:hypothetical protein